MHTQSMGFPQRLSTPQKAISFYLRFQCVEVLNNNNNCETIILRMSSIYLNSHSKDPHVHVHVHAFYIMYMYMYM